MSYAPTHYPFKKIDDRLIDRLHREVFISIEGLDAPRARSNQDEVDVSEYSRSGRIARAVFRSQRTDDDFAPDANFNLLAGQRHKRTLFNIFAVD